MQPKARSEELIVRDIEGEVVVFDLRNNRVHRLNESSAVVWRACDGKHDNVSLAKVLASKTMLPADEQIVRLALDELGRAGLLEEIVEPKLDLSRRGLFKKLGIAGTVVAMLPAVTTILAPTPAMAASGLTTPPFTTFPFTTPPFTTPPFTTQPPTTEAPTTQAPTTEAPTTQPPTTQPPTTQPPTTQPPTTQPPPTSPAFP